ncbi:MAG: HAD-superfamily hydrolase, subfamily IA, variant 1, partial [uncultured Solirubrobacteraceae bacterium]
DRHPRHRRHAGGLELPARARVVPRPARPRARGPHLADPPRDRHGRRPGRLAPLRAGRRGAPGGRRPRVGGQALLRDDRGGPAPRGLPRPRPRAQAAGPHGRHGVEREGGGGRALPHAPRRPRARRPVDAFGRRGADEARPRPRQGRPGQGGRRRRLPRRRHPVGRRGRRGRRGQDARRADGRLQHRGARGGRRRGGLRLHQGAPGPPRRDPAGRRGL